MMWHFGELGWDKSLWTCNNGNVSFSNPDCKLDTKPQYQWTENWTSNPERMNVYNQWAKQIDLRISEDVFENGQHAWNFNEVGRPRLDVWTSTSPTANLSYVFVRTNFSDNTYNTPGGFPFTGTWYNLMDNTEFTVTSTNQNITIEPGGYRVYGNRPTTLSTVQNSILNNLTLTPNPANNYFTINTDASISKIEIYSLTGQKVKSFENSYTNDYNYQISDLKSGMYLVTISTSDNLSKTVKLIKK